MADNKGIFLAEEERQMAEALDNAIPFKNKIAEAIDGIAFRIAIVIVDDYGIDKLSEAYKEKLVLIKEQAFLKNWLNAALGVWELALLIIKEQSQK